MPEPGWRPGFVPSTPSQGYDLLSSFLPAVSLLRWTVSPPDWHKCAEFAHQSHDHIPPTGLYAICFIFILNQTVCLAKSLSGLAPPLQRLYKVRLKPQRCKEHWIPLPPHVECNCLCPWLHTCIFLPASGMLAGPLKRDNYSAVTGFKVTNLPHAEAPGSVTSLP